MIRWCMYCQKYIGEAEPIEDFSLTHGVCEKCYDVFQKDPNQSKKLCDEFKVIREFYTELHEAIIQKHYLKARDLITKMGQGNLSTEDFLFGVMQPALYLIGQKWEAGTINVADEHIFTEIIQSAIDTIVMGSVEIQKYQYSKTPQVLLTCASGNFHSIGIKMLELYLSMNKVKVMTIIPGLDPKDLVESIIAYKPKIIGISIAISFQQKQLMQFDRLIKSKIDSSLLPKIFVGGFPIRKGMKLSTNSSLVGCSDIKMFLQSCNDTLGE